MKNRTRGHIAAIANAVFIGMSFIFTKFLVEGLGPMPGLWLRFMIATAAFLPLVLSGRINISMERGHEKKTALIAIFYPVLFFTLQAYGMKYADSSMAGIINGIHPVMVALLGIIFLREPDKKFVVYLLPFAGMLAIYLPTLDGSGNIFGTVLLTAATIAVSIYMVLVKKYSRGISPAALSWRLMYHGAIFYTAWILIFDFKNIGNYLRIITGSWLVLISALFLALFTSVGTSLLTAYSLKHLTAGESAVFINISTVLSVLLGFLILNEHITISMIAGMLLIGAGVFLSART